VVSADGTSVRTCCPYPTQLVAGVRYCCPPLNVVLQPGEQCCPRQRFYIDPATEQQRCCPEGFTVVDGACCRCVLVQQLLSPLWLPQRSRQPM
jgi:hypothetical protein